MLVGSVKSRFGPVIWASSKCLMGGAVIQKTRSRSIDSEKLKL